MDSPSSNPPTQHRPLTDERIAEILAVRARAGDPLAFVGDEDHARLAWLWTFTQGCWTGEGGGVAAAHGRLREKAEEMRPLLEIPIISGGVRGEIEKLESYTDDELRAYAARADDIDTVFGGQMRAAIAAAEEAMAAAETVHDDDPEARDWLSANGHSCALAGNRFESTAEALAFVESLYAAGAERVVVAAECIRDDESELRHGGPYADGLRVKLPADADARGAVLEIVNREMEEEGFDPEADAGQDVVFLWWD